MEQSNREIPVSDQADVSQSTDNATQPISEGLSKAVKGGHFFMTSRPNIYMQRQLPARIKIT